MESPSKGEQLRLMATIVADTAHHLALSLRQMLINNSRLSSMIAKTLNPESLNTRQLHIMVDLMPVPPGVGTVNLKKKECIAYLKHKL